MTGLAPFVRILGRGPSRARNLTEDEAQEAMSVILSGNAAPEAIGALLMLMRYRGENAAEVAGFTRALRATLPVWSGLSPAVDWPTYAAGRSRGLPLFLLAARLLARAGCPVLLHGWNSHQNPVADVRLALPHAGIGLVDNVSAAEAEIAQSGIAYLPLDVLSPEAQDLLELRDILGLRSCLNTVCRMINPGGASLSVQGVFHPSYRELQRDTAILLGQKASLTIKGGGGEFERHPGKLVEVIGQVDEREDHRTEVPILKAATRLAEGPDLPQEPGVLAALWDGSISDPFAEAVIIGTAALVLRAVGQGTTDQVARARALDLWANRHVSHCERIPA